MSGVSQHIKPQRLYPWPLFLLGFVQTSNIVLPGLLNAHSVPMSQHDGMSGEGWVKVVQIQDKSQI